MENIKKHEQELETHICNICQKESCQCRPVILASEQPKEDKCQYCGAGRVVRPSGEWQYYCNCDDPIKRPEQPINTGCAAKEDNECECQMCGDTKQIYGDPYGVPCPECVVKSSNLEIIKQIVGCIRVESALLNELRKACE